MSNGYNEFDRFRGKRFKNEFELIDALDRYLLPSFPRDSKLALHRLFVLKDDTQEFNKLELKAIKHIAPCIQYKIDCSLSHVMHDIRRRHNI